MFKFRNSFQNKIVVNASYHDDKKSSVDVVNTNNVDVSRLTPWPKLLDIQPESNVPWVNSMASPPELDLFNKSSSNTGCYSDLSHFLLITYYNHNKDGKKLRILYLFVLDKILKKLGYFRIPLNCYFFLDYTTDFFPISIGESGKRPVWSARDYTRIKKKQEDFSNYVMKNMDEKGHRKNLQFLEPILYTRDIHYYLAYNVKKRIKSKKIQACLDEVMATYGYYKTPPHHLPCSDKIVLKSLIGWPKRDWAYTMISPLSFRSYFRLKRRRYEKKS